MAYGMNPGPTSGGGGGEDYYSDTTPESKESPSEESKEHEGQMQTTIPKAMLMGKDFKVGEEVIFEITGIHGDEVSITYATEKGEGKEEGEGEGAEEGEGGRGYGGPPGDTEMASMMD